MQNELNVIYAEVGL